MINEAYSRRIMSSGVLIVVSLVLLGGILGSELSVEQITGAAVGDPCTLETEYKDCDVDGGEICQEIPWTGVWICTIPCAEDDECPDGYKCYGHCFPPEPEGDCDNEVDDDEDGDTDCQDSDCDGETGPGGGTCESPESSCDDGYDNDGDGDADCADEDCDGEQGPGFTCENPEQTCNDEEDNDMDGNADCDDSDCSGDPACQAQEVCDNGIDDDGDNDKDCCDSDCDSDSYCQAESCTSDLECSPFACSSETCICKETCSSDVECASGYVCDAPGCVPEGNGNGGGTCVDSDCIPYKCETSSTCYTFCTSDSNCYNSSYFCNTTTSSCELITGGDGETCEDADCNPYKCKNETACYTSCSTADNCFNSSYFCNSTGACVYKFCIASECKPYGCMNQTACYENCTSDEHCFSSSYACNTTGNECYQIEEYDEEDTTLGTAELTVQCRGKHDVNSHSCNTGEKDFVYQSSELSCCCDSGYVIQSFPFIGKKCAKPVGGAGGADEGSDSDSDSGAAPGAGEQAFMKREFMKVSYFTWFLMLTVMTAIIVAVVVFLIRSKTRLQAQPQPQMMPQTQQPNQMPAMTGSPVTPRQQVQLQFQRLHQTQPQHKKPAESPARIMKYVEQPRVKVRDSLKDYVDSARAQGFSDEQIKQELLKKGWKPEQIQPYFS